MDAVLSNPTDKLDKKFQEVFKGFYLGKLVTIEPGQKLKVSDKTARHLLNELGPRGLFSLDFGDDAEEKAKEALERNRAFKVKQINDFNEKNSARKHRGLEYLWPADHIKLYAKEIGVKLVESYQVDDAQLQKVKTLETENKQLRDQMTEMNEKMTQILEQMKRPEVKEFVEAIETPLTKDGRPDKRFKGD